MIICSKEFISSDANLRNTRAVEQDRIHLSTRHRKWKREGNANAFHAKAQPHNSYIRFPYFPPICLVSSITYFGDEAGQICQVLQKVGGTRQRELQGTEHPHGRSLLVQSDRAREGRRRMMGRGKMMVLEHHRW
jgi:hypothetical protein